MAEPIVIVDYNQEWPNIFMALKNHLSEALGPSAFTFEHVGSTAIPGAAAKPIIDIDIVIRSNSDLPSVIQTLDLIGYHHVGNLGIEGREAFANPPNLPSHHLYVVVLGNRPYAEHIKFRDYLRKHKGLVNEYSALKKSLAAKFMNDRESYTNAKTDFIQNVLKRAEENQDR